MAHFGSYIKRVEFSVDTPVDVCVRLHNHGIIIFELTWFGKNLLLVSFLIGPGHICTFGTTTTLSTRHPVATQNDLTKRDMMSILQKRRLQRRQLVAV